MSPAAKAALRAVRLGLPLLAAVAGIAPVRAGTCIVQGRQAWGDCQVVQYAPSQPVAVLDTGAYNGNFGQAVVRRHADVTLSGNAEQITVEPRARLFLSGNASTLQVWGFAELTGNAGRVIVHPGGTAVIRGTAGEVSGPGRVIAAKGSVVGGMAVN